MSALFGPVIQQGYVVPDIEQAMQHWIARGVGPFFVEKHIRPKGEYDGQAIQPDLSAAFAYSGDQQIEVIQHTMTRPPSTATTWPTTPRAASSTWRSGSTTSPTRSSTSLHPVGTTRFISAMATGTPTLIQTMRPA